jgi:beta-lactamase class D
MVKKWLPVIAFLVVMSVVPIHSLIAQQKRAQEDSIALFLDRWHRAAAEADLTGYLGAMAPGAVYAGTDATEYWTKDEFADFCRPWFEKKRTWDFRAVSRHIYLSPDGTVAWFDEILKTHMGLCRGSGVLQKQDKNWFIEQYILSPTVPNSQISSVTRNKMQEDSAAMLQTIFDKHGLRGTMIIVDPSKGAPFGHNPALWDSGYLPASTFKIPNSLIALETGVTDTNYIFRWDGKKRRLPQWEQDLTLKQAFAVSCVPCFQEVARKIGPERMKEYLAKLNYGNMDVTLENIDLFWLEGNSRISPRQQVDFLRRLNEGTLPVSRGTMAIMNDIMTNERTGDFTLRGKTGWAIRNGNNYGWFVGWLETAGRTIYLATLVEPKDQKKVTDFATARKTVTMEVLRLYRLIP